MPWLFVPLPGTGHLAASLAGACAQGTSIETVRAFYAQRLARAISVHLRGLSALYSEAPFRSGWANEIAAVRKMSDAIEPAAQAPGGRSFTISEQGATALS